MSSKISAAQYTAKESSSKLVQAQISERRLVPEREIESALQTLKHLDDSIGIAQFPNPIAQAKLNQVVQSLTQNATFNCPKGQLGHTNGVLLNVSPNEDVEIFIAGYMRMKIRSLIKVDISSQETQVNALIQFSINYGKLPRLIVDYLKQSLVIRFSKKNSILLKQTQDSQLTIKVIEDDFLSLITFSVDFPLTFHFQPYYPFQWINVDMSIWLSPFEKINNVLTVTIEDLVVRYDDLMVEFSSIYTNQEFQQVQNYFKHLKKSNQNIRKLIIKVNLMNLSEPNQTVLRKTIDQNSPPDDLNKIQNQERIEEVSLSQLVRQKYHQMTTLYNSIEQEGNLPMHKFKFNSSNMSNQFKIYQLNQEISTLLNQYSMSPNKLTYEEEHLLGQYQIVSSQLNVRFSCYKYLKLQKKIEIRSKICSYIQQIKYQAFQSTTQNDPKEKQIVDKILSKQNLNNQFSSNPEIIIPDFPSEILIKQSLSSKVVSLKKDNEYPNEEEKQRNDVIKQVAEEMQRGKEGPKTFQFAHFQLSIYKHPFVPLAIVFFPLWIIATINLIIYFSSRNLSDRIGNIATLLISYVAYFPIFRQQIPEYRYLLLAQIFAYLQIVCSFLTLLHSVIYKQNIDETFRISNVGVVFWVSLGITVITILAVIIAYVYHKCIIEERYKTKADNKTQATALRHILWNNYECDLAFMKKENYILLKQCISFDKFIQIHYPCAKIRKIPLRFHRKISFDIAK